MEVVSISSRSPQVRIEEEQKKSMLEVLDHMRASVEKGEIKEFVACSADEDGVAMIHVAAMDMIGSVGLYEIGKHLLINGETLFD